MVTLAPRLLTSETDNEVAFVISALRSRSPVIPIAPRPTVPPVSASNCTSEVPASNVRLFVSEVSESTVPLNVI